jgi:hypothetical protein
MMMMTLASDYGIIRFKEKELNHFETVGKKELENAR